MDNKVFAIFLFIFMYFILLSFITNLVLFPQYWRKPEISSVAVSRCASIEPTAVWFQDWTLASMSHPLWQLMQRKHCSYPCHVITLPDTLRRVKPCFHQSAFAEPILQKLCIFRSSCKMVSTDPTDMPALAAICFPVKRRSSITICSTRAIMSSDRLVHGRGSFGLFSYDVRLSQNCRTHERTFFTSITLSLHVSLNCWWTSCHASGGIG